MHEPHDPEPSGSCRPSRVTSSKRSAGLSDPPIETSWHTSTTPSNPSSNQTGNYPCCADPLKTRWAHPHHAEGGADWGVIQVNLAREAIRSDTEPGLRLTLLTLGGSAAHEPLCRLSV
jgi:hypothetical protein